MCVQVQEFFVEYGVTTDSYNAMRSKTALTDEDLRAIVLARKSAKSAAPQTAAAASGASDMAVD